MGWSEAPSSEALAAAGPALEGGAVLFLPDLAFGVEPSEPGEHGVTREPAEREIGVGHRGRATTRPVARRARV